MNSHDKLILAITVVCLVTNFAGAFFAIERLLRNNERQFKLYIFSRGLPSSVGAGIYYRVKPEFRSNLFRSIASQLSVFAALLLLFNHLFRNELPIFLGLNEFERFGIFTLVYVSVSYLIDLLLALFHAIDVNRSRPATFETRDDTDDMT